MKQLFSEEAPVTAFLAVCCDLMVLNLAWLACCLPLVTAGASTAAMHAVAHQLSDNRCSSVLPAFFEALRREWKQGTQLFAVLGIWTAIAAVDLWVVFRGLLGQSLLSWLCLLPACALLFASVYVFPLQVRFQNTVWGTLKNAMLLSLANLPVTIAAVFLNLLPLTVFLYSQHLFFRTAAVWLIVGVSATAYGSARLMKRIFLRIAESA